MADNLLYYGDNLEVLRKHVADESVDLVYLDPPFKSDRNYNVLFAEQDGSRAAAQIQAFKDTWEWDRSAAAAYQNVVEAGGAVSQALQAFRGFLHTGPMLAYVVMMAQRLLELRRVMKPTASLYLHCDPTASHYLKLLLDGVFGPQRFLNEVTWKRSSAHSDTKQGMKRCGKIRDVLLFYSKGEDYTWNPQYTPYAQDYLETEYRHVDKSGRRYKETDVTAAKPGGDTEFDWHVKRRTTPGSRWEADLEDEHASPRIGREYKAVRPYQGRFWAYSKENLAGFARDGHLIHRETGMPRLVQFTDEMPGVALQDLWDDIPPELGDKNLGYPTQKPEALLERIITASSNKGDTVLDPFCGCGTAVAVSQRLGRRWIGIDITHLAIALIKQRLNDAFGDKLVYKVVGEPVDLESARALAAADKYQFQWWAVSLVLGRPAEKKKGADKGIDGRLFFHDEPEGGKTKQVIISVKGGGTGVADVRDLRGVIEREKAEIGLLITLETPTQPMRTECAGAGHYKSPWGTRHPQLQLLTIEELLAGKRIDMPPTRDLRTFKKAPKVRGSKTPEPELFENGPDDPD